MNNIQGSLVMALVGLAMVFVILGGIRSSAPIINPILLALVITITVLPLKSSALSIMSLLVTACRASAAPRLRSNRDFNTLPGQRVS